MAMATADMMRVSGSRSPGVAHDVGGEAIHLDRQPLDGGRVG